MENISRSAGTAPGLVPVSGAALYAREIERREELRERGVVSTGCSEIDDALLLGGGFERGCVVGVSAEELDFGILVSTFFFLLGNVERLVGRDGGSLWNRCIFSRLTTWIC